MFEWLVIMFTHGLELDKSNPMTITCYLNDATSADSQTINIIYLHSFFFLIDAGWLYVMKCSSCVCDLFYSEISFIQFYPIHHC